MIRFLTEKLLLTNTHFSKIRKAFTNGSSTKIEVSKSQLSEIGQLRGFLGKLLEPLIKTDLPLIGNILKPLAKSIVVPSGLATST